MSYESDPGRFYDIGVQDAVSKEWRTIRQLPSVTTILGCASKDSLPNWAYAVTVEGVAKLLEEEKISKGSSVDQIKLALKMGKLRHMDIRDSAADRGTLTHDLVETLDLFGADQAEPQDPWQEGLVKWWRIHKPKPLMKEVAVASLEGGWAGRIDMVCSFSAQNGLTLVDFKTVKNKDYFKRYPASYESHRVQLCVYRQALIEENPGLKIDRLVVVRVADGEYHHYEVPPAQWEPAVDYFRGCLKIFEYRALTA